MPAARFVILVIASTLWVVNGANAQVQPQTPSPYDLLDQTIEDRGPLSVSLRDTAVDFRLPNNFQQVMRVPGRPDLLMRMSGALYAVFDESVYSSASAADASSTRPRALIPPGTVFYIGLPPQLSGQSLFQAPHADDHRISREVVRKIEHLPNGLENAAPMQPETALPQADLPEPPTIVSNADYRAHRIAQLLKRAANAQLHAKELEPKMNTDEHR